MFWILLPVGSHTSPGLGHCLWFYYFCSFSGFPHLYICCCSTLIFCSWLPLIMRSTTSSTCCTLPLQLSRDRSDLTSVIGQPLLGMPLFSTCRSSCGLFMGKPTFTTWVVSLNRWVRIWFPLPRISFLQNNEKGNSSSFMCSHHLSRLSLLLDF